MENGNLEKNKTESLSDCESLDTGIQMKKTDKKKKKKPTSGKSSGQSSGQSSAKRHLKFNHEEDYDFEKISTSTENLNDSKLMSIDN